MNLPSHCLAIVLSLLAATTVHADDTQQLLTAHLQELASGSPQSEIIAPTVVVALYEQQGRTLLWDEPKRQALLSALAKADLDGLDPKDYNAVTLSQLAPLNTLAPNERVNADIALTDALLRYVYHLRFGKVNPASHDANWNFPRRVRSEDPIAALGQLLAAADFAQALSTFAPQSPLYRGLKAQLARYREIEKNGAWPSVETRAVVKPGANDSVVPLLRKRLASEGFAVADLNSTDYDAPLEEAVRSFQKMNGIQPDGVVGARTQIALNVPVRQRIDQIRVNLERMRWVEGARSSRFLAVNVAGFEVHLIEGDHSVWSARAMVGTPYRQTPIFMADMKYIVFNPDWTVPPTILRKDVLPALAKDPAYLTIKHMEVIDGDRKRVDPATIDWHRYPAAPFPYMIRQTPGPWNALGQIKFIFPNSHFVFLHDTPSRDLFARPERAFSSGCIRVEHPFELAQLLLPDWDQARIDRIVQGDEETTVFLPEPLPVLLVYLTALGLQDGTMRFYRDVYERDAWVLAALSAGFTYSAPAGLPTG